MILAVLLLVAADPVAHAPPFSYGLDQSSPCPAGSEDYALGAANGGIPIDETDKELQDAFGEIPAALDVKMKQLNCPSVSVVVVQGGKTLFTSFRGSARYNESAPLSDTSGYQIASISKTFTSVMLFKLRDEGKLPQGLDTPVSALLPDFSIKSPYPSKRPITLRSLAMHASGLPRETPECYRCSQEEILRKISGLYVLCEQYHGTHYSNLGLALLGRSLEVAAGKSWERFMVEDIMTPLRMNNSGPPPADNVHMADGVDPESGALVHPPSNSTWDAPCGAIHSTIRDMAIWMNFLMDAPPNEAERASFAAVLDSSTRAEMRRSGMVQGDGVTAVGSGTFEMAYSNHTERWTVNKLGCLGGYRSSFSLVPSLKLGVFAVATSTCDLYGDGDAVGFPIVSTLTPIVGRILDARSTDSAAAAPTFMPPQELLANMTGVYCTANTSSLEALSVRVETVTPDGTSSGIGTYQHLVWRPTSSASYDYPFVLQWLGWESDLDDLDAVASAAAIRSVNSSADANSIAGGKKVVQGEKRVVQGKGRGVFRKVMGPEK
jgi:CubicO group peptidase (beta-lactamase class C family)